jgi:choline-sulfatase
MRAVHVVPAALALVLAGSLAYVVSREYATRPALTGRSILLVTLDTTRADRLGPYGYPLADTPTLDQLAADGTRYTRAYAPAPLTIPSHATIMTGRVPPTHGVRDNGDFVLGDDEITIAEQLADAGYATGAVTAAFPTQRRWGLAQGFGVYHDPLPDLPTRLDWSDQRRADDVVDDALGVLTRLAAQGRPVFLWVHLFDPHWPYDPPEPYASAHEGRPYDGEISFADAELGRLIRAWDAAFDDSVVLVTADHGEGFGDGGELTHGFLLHDATVRVPLIARGADFAPGAIVDDPVGLVDIAPTLLATAGAPVPPGVQGVDLRLGGSEVLYAEALTGQFNLGLAPLRGFTGAEGRYVEGGWGGWYPLTDGLVDVAAQRRGVSTGPERAQLHALIDAYEPGTAPTAALDAEALQQLAALGYLGGDPHAAPGTVDPRDVIDVIPLSWQARQLVSVGMFTRAEKLIGELDARMPRAWGVELLRAQIDRARGRLDQAALAFTQLYVEAPGSTVALQLADIAMARGDAVEAEQWYREALDLQPRSPDAMAGLVRALLAEGELVLADELAGEFLLAYPDHVEMMLLQAELALAEGLPEQALAAAEPALRVLPRSAWAHLVTARASWELGDAERAVERAQDSLRLDPFQVPVRMLLASWLLEMGRNAEAVRLLAPAVRIVPDAPGLDELATEARGALDAELEANGRPGGAKSTGLLRAYDANAAAAHAKDSGAPK